MLHSKLSKLGNLLLRKPDLKRSAVTAYEYRFRDLLELCLLTRQDGLELIQADLRRGDGGFSLVLGSVYEADYVTVPKVSEKEWDYLSPERLHRMIADLHKKMMDAAQKWEFEEAARLRDEIKELENRELEARG